MALMMEISSSFISSFFEAEPPQGATEASQLAWGEGEGKGSPGGEEE